MRTAHLRIARATTQLESLVEFYSAGLGFKEMGRFVDHAGFDGVMLGHPEAAYHLEFTCNQGQTKRPSPAADDLLVFYLPDEHAWRTVVQTIEERGHASVPAHNPYWDQQGRTYEDPDGFRIVIQHGAWPSEHKPS